MLKDETYYMSKFHEMAAKFGDLYRDKEYGRAAQVYRNAFAAAMFLELPREKLSELFGYWDDDETDAPAPKGLLTDVIKNSEYLQLTVRTDPRGKRYLTVKDGMIVVGMISQVRIVSEEYIDHLHEFLGECRMQLEREKAREAQEEDEEQEKPRA